jgi:hypothetical protein
LTTTGDLSACKSKRNTTINRQHTRTPPMRQEWFSHGGSRLDRFDRMDRSIDRHDRINVANPTFEKMSRHWFDTFGTNPSVESFARSRSWF